jgi:hypothetical protein
MKVVAIKKGQLRAQPRMADPREMGALRCDGSGEKFIIITPPPSRTKQWPSAKRIGSGLMGHRTASKANRARQQPGARA